MIKEQFTGTFALHAPIFNTKPLLTCEHLVNVNTAVSFTLALDFLDNYFYTCNCPISRGSLLFLVLKMSEPLTKKMPLMYGKSLAEESCPRISGGIVLIFAQYQKHIKQI